MTRLILALSVLGLAAGCASPPPPRPAGEAEVEAAVRALYADLSARSWAALEVRFAPGATISSLRGGKVDTRGLVDFLAMMRETIEPLEVFEERCVEVQVRAHPNVAHAWSRFEGKMGKADSPRTWSGVDSWTFLRVDGVWKVTSISVGVD